MMVTITETRADTPASVSYGLHFRSHLHGLLSLFLPQLSKRHSYSASVIQENSGGARTYPQVIAPTGQTEMLRNTAHLLRLTRVCVRKL